MTAEMRERDSVRCDVLQDAQGGEALAQSAGRRWQREVVVGMSEPVRLPILAFG